MVLKSEHLLAKGYDPVIGLTVPIGTTNNDLGIDGSEPKNSEKLAINVGDGKMNMYVSVQQTTKRMRKHRSFISFTAGAIISAMSVQTRIGYNV